MGGGGQDLGGDVWERGHRQVVESHSASASNTGTAARLPRRVTCGIIICFFLEYYVKNAQLACERLVVER